MNSAVLKPGFTESYGKLLESIDVQTHCGTIKSESEVGNAAFVFYKSSPPELKVQAGSMAQVILKVVSRLSKILYPRESKS